MQAALGNHLRGVSDGALDELITTERIGKQFRASLDLDTNSSDNFARAGSFYLEEEDYGEAERCLARGFRLNRSSGHLALRLSEVYTRTDRPRDAVAVLDMALREGCDDPDVAWEAAMNAIHTEQYEATLTYLDRYDALLPAQPWSNYYRASALLELHRPAESLAALVLEMQFNPDLTYHVSVLRASALAALKEIDAFRNELGEVLAMPLSEVTYLTANGLQKMFLRLWQSTRECVGQDDPSLVQLETRLLESGLAPNELFAVYRQPVTEESSQNKVNFYRCVFRQPLDERWRSFGGQLAGEEDWTAYEIPWGVLAHDEAEAGQMAMQWQQRCFPLAAELLGIEEEGTDYTDAAGVVWQGYREGILPDSDDEDDSEIE
jgi:tetratricopeptide (TPR) repeat protein